MTNVSDFVVELTNAKKDFDGIHKDYFYLEIGVGDWDKGNNSYELEKSHGWKGISIDNTEKFVKSFNDNRNNLCVNKDATKINFRDFFKEHNVPERIDYLQIDLHGNHESGKKAEIDIDKPLKTLVSLPLNDYRFSIITFDFGNLNHFKNWGIRDAQRQILSSFGYFLLVDLFYEDWWVDGEYIPHDVFSKFHRWTK